MEWNSDVEGDGRICSFFAFPFLTFSCACAVAERGSNIMGIGNVGMVGMGIRNMGILRVKESVSDSPVGKSRDVFVYLLFSGLGQTGYLSLFR